MFQPQIAYNSPSMTVAVRSFAKINLGLYIGAVRADGFHDLRTVYQTIALHDVIRVSVGRGSGIEILCEDPRVPLDSANTCYRVAERVMDELGAKGRVSIEIEKRLPVQGGLGAASSNAVATMVALERALRGFRNWRKPPSAVPQGLKPALLADLTGTLRLRSGQALEAVPLPKTVSGRSGNSLKKTKTLSGEARLRIAAEVGSDLPLFLVGGTVLGVGRGEEVYPLPDLASIAMVVVTPEVGVSTPEAFGDWDALMASGAELRSAGQPRAAFPTRVRTGQSPVTTQNSATAQNSATMQNRQLTRPLASDRLFEVGCVLSAWLSGSPNVIGSPNTGASAKGGSRAGNLLSDLVRTGIENDFEKVVFPKYPVLRDIKGELERAGSRYASLSGSGSTLYGLFRSPAEAMKAASRLRSRGLKAVATSTLTRQKYWKRILD
jgi:4-diphosphocytidyl-2-C-methyl-D-erythritol kinase